jgi:hypothetical protein
MLTGASSAVRFWNAKSTSQFHRKDRKDREDIHHKRHRIVEPSHHRGNPSQHRSVATPKARRQEADQSRRAFKESESTNCTMGQQCDARCDGLCDVLSDLCDLCGKPAMSAVPLRLWRRCGEIAMFSFPQDTPRESQRSKK